MWAGCAVQKLMMQIEHEQEVLMHLSDMAIDTFQAESVLLRAMKMQEAGHPLADMAADVARTFIYDAADRINAAGKNAVNAFADGDEQRMMLLGVKRFTKAAAFNATAARRRIADKACEVAGYMFK